MSDHSERDPDKGPCAQHRQRSYGPGPVEERAGSQTGCQRPRRASMGAICPHGAGMSCQAVVAPENANPKNHATSSVRRIPAILAMVVSPHVTAAIDPAPRVITSSLENQDPAQSPSTP